MQALAEMRAEAAYPKILQIFRESQHITRRAAAAQALGTYGGKENVRMLVTALQSEMEPVRRSIVDGLMTTESPEAIKAVERVAQEHGVAGAEARRLLEQR
jgi:HEAT repeat protein